MIGNLAPLELLQLWHEGMMFDAVSVSVWQYSGWIPC